MHGGRTDRQPRNAAVSGNRVLALLPLMAVALWFVASAPEPGAPADGLAGGACGAAPGAVQQDVVDSDDSPEFPWPHTSGQGITVHFETRNIPLRYARLAAEAAALWARSPCVEATAVDTCPAGANCSSLVVVRARSDDRDTDGESESVDRGGLRRSNTITLYSQLLDMSSDNGALATIVHEMGHALGLVHRNDRDSVMNAVTNDSTEPVPDTVDFANLQAIYG